MKHGIIFESIGGAAIDMPQEPVNLVGYAAHLKSLGFLTEYKTGKIRPYLQGIKHPFLFLIIDEPNLSNLPKRVTVPPLSLNKFCYDISTHKEQRRRAQKGKSGNFLTGYVLLRREISKTKLIKEFIEAGCPENWTPKPLEF